MRARWVNPGFLANGAARMYFTAGEEAKLRVAVQRRAAEQMQISPVGGRILVRLTPMQER
jgi:hypothetical protein